MACRYHYHAPPCQQFFFLLGRCRHLKHVHDGTGDLSVSPILFGETVSTLVAERSKVLVSTMAPPDSCRGVLLPIHAFFTVQIPSL